MKQMHTTFFAVISLAIVLSLHINCQAGTFYLNGEAVSQPQMPVDGGDGSASPAAPGSATVITFDEFYAPCGFQETVLLLEQYADLGVHFRGPTPSDGAAALGQCGNFGVDAHSGTQFLAFNRQGSYHGGGSPTDPETIAFDEPMAAVSIYVASGFTNSAGDFVLSAYATDGALLAVDGISTPAETWAMLNVTSAAGIDYVVLEGPVNEVFFVADDLSFTPVPEPMTVSMLLMGAAAALHRRRSSCP